MLHSFLSPHMDQYMQYLQCLNKNLSSQIIIMSLSQFNDLSVRQFKGSMDIRYSVRQINLGSQLLFAIITTNQNFLILDLTFEDISFVIRRNAYPRMARLSPCERFTIASFSDNTVFLYDTKTGTPIQKILGIPRGASSFMLSGDSRRLFFANNNTICLWSIAKAQLELSTAQWKNINCYAIDSSGNKLALGTYSGTIIVLTILTIAKVSEMDLKRHKTCVMAVAFCKNKIFSVSYDCIFLTTTINNTTTGQKTITYLELQLQSVPRSIQGVIGVPHLFETQGVFWIVEGNKMRGYAQGLYAVAEREKQVNYLRYCSGKIEWFRR